MAGYLKELNGKWALILGASSGFGGAAARALAQSGMHICGVHLDRKATLVNVEDIKKSVEATGREALFFNLGVDGVENMVDG